MAGLDGMTIGGWETERFEREALADLASLDTIQEPPLWPREQDSEDVPSLVSLRERITAGLAVQLLVNLETREAFITLAIDGRTETFPVPAEAANDAFAHPYCYGGSLAIR